MVKYLITLVDGLDDPVHPNGHTRYEDDPIFANSLLEAGEIHASRTGWKPKAGSIRIIRKERVI